jgi:tetratricopeptide (TPR) repeat protein
VKLSLCMIVKNEERNLPACLASAAGLADEVVIVDTGSGDRTVEIAWQHGASVFHFPWIDNFAAARNESLRHANGEWVFWLDADDRLDADHHGRMRRLIDALPAENVAFVMKCLCLPDPVSRRSTTVDHVRLFRRHPELRWRYRVHEQILPGLRELGARICWSDVVIQHTGYQDPGLRQRKLERDFRLLQLDHAEMPGDAFVLFNLGMILHEWGRYAEALPYLAESLQRSHPTDSIVRKLFALVVQCQRQLGRLEEALTTCREGRRHYPQDVELRFHESVVLKALGDTAGSEGCLLDLLYAQEGEHFASVNPALRAIARHNLAVLCREQGRDGEAESHWQGAVAGQPEYVPCWIGLGELYLAQQRWAELEGVLARLEADDLQDLSQDAGSVEAKLLRARAEMARGEFAAAQRRLRGLIEREPTVLMPRVLLSHALLQQGRDWAAAEQALRDVLSVAPDHAESRRNLAILLRQTG